MSEEIEGEEEVIITDPLGPCNHGKNSKDCLSCQIDEVMDEYRCYNFESL